MTKLAQFDVVAECLTQHRESTVCRGHRDCRCGGWRRLCGVCGGEPRMYSIFCYMVLVDIGSMYVDHTHGSGPIPRE